MTTVVDTGPLDWRIAITDGNGRPTNEFQRRWNTQRNNNGLITSVTVASGAPGDPVPSDGNEYIDISTNPPTFYVASDGTWLAVGVYEFTELSDVPDSYSGSGTKLVQVKSDDTGLQFTTLSSVLDSLGSTEGDVLYRDSSGWNSLAPGTSGQVLITGGSGAAPAWGTGGGGGSSLQIFDHGTSLTTAATSINFTGGQITTTASGDAITVDVDFATIADSTLLANISGGSAAPVAETLSAVLDHVLTTTEGSLIYRGSSVWTHLTPGTSGQVLATGGSGAAPSWVNQTGGGGVSGVLPLVNGDLPGPSFLADPYGQTIGCPL